MGCKLTTHLLNSIRVGNTDRVRSAVERNRHGGCSRKRCDKVRNYSGNERTSYITIAAAAAAAGLVDAELVVAFVFESPCGRS